MACYYLDNTRAISLQADEKTAHSVVENSLDPRVKPEDDNPKLVVLVCHSLKAPTIGPQVLGGNPLVDNRQDIVH
jgi:hypothetical protein